MSFYPRVIWMGKKVYLLYNKWKRQFYTDDASTEIENVFLYCFDLIFDSNSKFKMYYQSLINIKKSLLKVWKQICEKS